MPLIIIQFVLVWYCELHLFGCRPHRTLTRADMVETKGYTLEEVSLAFDGRSSSLLNVNLLQHGSEVVGDQPKVGDEEAK